MARKVKYLTTLVGFLAFASAALGQTVQMTLTGVNGANAGGVYTSPYYGTVTSGNVTTNVTMICDDYTTDIGNPWGPWTAVATNAAVAGTSGAGRFASTGGQQAYNEVAWLATQLIQGSNYSSPTAIAISYAIWEIMDPGTASTDPLANDPNTALSQSEIMDAQNAVSAGYTGTNVTVYTPAANSPVPSQEFLVITPEPVAAAVVCVNLLTVLALVVYRRRCGAQSVA